MQSIQSKTDLLKTAEPVSTNSAVFDHQQTTGHTFDLEVAHILDRETCWFERGVRESIYERKESPALNIARRRASDMNCLIAGINASSDTGCFAIRGIQITAQKL